MLEKTKSLFTLAVSNVRVVFSVGDEDPEEFSLTLDSFWAVPHQTPVSRERTLCGSNQV